MSPLSPREEFAGRVARALAAMAAAGVEVLPVDHAECLAWLTDDALVLSELTDV